MQLRTAGDGVKIHPDIFGFDVTQCEIPAGNQVIRRAAGIALRLVDRANAGIKRLQQLLKRGAVGMFRGDTPGVFPLEVLEIGLQTYGHFSTEHTLESARLQGVKSGKG